MDNPDDTTDQLSKKQFQTLISDVYDGAFENVSPEIEADAAKKILTYINTLRMRRVREGNPMDSSDVTALGFDTNELEKGKIRFTPVTSKDASFRKVGSKSMNGKSEGPSGEEDTE